MRLHDLRAHGHRVAHSEQQSTPPGWTGTDPVRFHVAQAVNAGTAVSEDVSRSAMQGLTTGLCSRLPFCKTGMEQILTLPLRSVAAGVGWLACWQLELLAEWMSRPSNSSISPMACHSTACIPPSGQARHFASVPNCCVIQRRFWLSWLSCDSSPWRRVKSVLEQSEVLGCRMLGECPARRMGQMMR